MAAIDWYWDDETFNTNVVRSNRAGIGAATFSEANKASIYAIMVLAPHHANARAQDAKDNRKPSKPSQIEVKQGSKKIDAFMTLYDPAGHAGAISPQIDLMWRVMSLL